MKFTNVPRAIPLALYDVAAREYARSAGRRAVAIHRVGAFAQDGISDLDLLVIPRRAHPENPRWSAVRNHLPLALRAPFRHDPDFVPLDHVDALRFTSHANRSLVFGEDVAAHVRCVETPEQRWSMLFERLSSLERHHERVGRRGRADLWKLLSRTKSVGTSLANLDLLVGSREADRVVPEVEALRAHFFDLDPAEAGARCWALFDRGFCRLKSALTRTLPLAPGEPTADFGRRFLHGEAAIPGLCELELAERRETVLRVQRAAFEFGCGVATSSPRFPTPGASPSSNARAAPPRGGAWRWPPPSPRAASESGSMTASRAPAAAPPARTSSNPNYA